LLAMVPVLLITNQKREPLVVGLLYTTLYMVLASGRMVPAMAMVTSSARTAYRGSFMSVIAAVQLMAIGLAAQVAALFILQPGGAKSPLETYPRLGLFACSMTRVAVSLVGHIRPATEAESTSVAEEEAAAADSFVPSGPLPEPVREAS